MEQTHPLFAYITGILSVVIPLASWALPKSRKFIVSHVKILQGLENSYEQYLRKTHAPIRRIIKLINIFIYLGIFLILFFVMFISCSEEYKVSTKLFYCAGSFFIMIIFIGFGRYILSYLSEKFNVD